MFMAQILKKYPQEEQDKINTTLISPIFRDLVQTHIESVGGKLIQLRPEDPLFIAEYTTLQQQLKLWQGFAEYINSFVKSHNAAKPK